MDYLSHFNQKAFTANQSQITKSKQLPKSMQLLYLKYSVRIPVDTVMASKIGFTKTYILNILDYDAQYPKTASFHAELVPQAKDMTTGKIIRGHTWIRCSLQNLEDLIHRTPYKTKNSLRYLKNHGFLFEARHFYSSFDSVCWYSVNKLKYDMCVDRILRGDTK